MAYESLDTIRALLKRLSYAPKTSATGTDMGRGRQHMLDDRRRRR
jgi:hypothetical protein